MITRFKTIVLTATTMLMTGSQASAHFAGTPAYRTTYYNNANHDIEVGHIQPWGGCTYDEVTDTDFVNYRLFGSMSAYHTEEQVGWCWYGEFTYL